MFNVGEEECAWAVDYFKKKQYIEAEGYFKKYDEFQQECIRKFNIMYDENYILVNNIQLTYDEKEYIEKTKNLYESQHIHQIPMLPRH